MKWLRIISFIPALLSPYCLLAQTVANVKSEQHGNKVIVYYDLVQGPQDKVYNVQVAMSKDGRSFGQPLKSVSGDVGSGVRPGTQKTITWDVLADLPELSGSQISFKVLAEASVAAVAGPLDMVLVEGGSFTMGNNSGQRSEKPEHKVTLKTYYIGKYEVTQKQWTDIMGYNPSKFKGCDGCPVENVSWEEVQQFIKKLNTLTGQKYRLPTEAEWEYAAIGGKKGKKTPYSGSLSANEVGWNQGNSSKKTHPVGSKKANELGIFDMTGNVWEWCEDWYGNYGGEATNPRGPASGTNKIRRGGSFSVDTNYATTTYRSLYGPAVGREDMGFRLVLDK